MVNKHQEYDDINFLVKKIVYNGDGSQLSGIKSMLKEGIDILAESNIYKRSPFIQALNLIQEEVIDAMLSTNVHNSKFQAYLTQPNRKLATVLTKLFNSRFGISPENYKNAFRILTKLVDAGLNLKACNDLDKFRDFALKNEWEEFAVLLFRHGASWKQNTWGEKGRLDVEGKQSGAFYTCVQARLDYEKERRPWRSSITEKTRQELAQYVPASPAVVTIPSSSNNNNNNNTTTATQAVSITALILQKQATLTQNQDASLPALQTELRQELEPLRPQIQEAYTAHKEDKETKRLLLKLIGEVDSLRKDVTPVIDAYTNTLAVESEKQRLKATPQLAQFYLFLKGEMTHELISASSALGPYVTRGTTAKDTVKDIAAQGAAAFFSTAPIVGPLVGLVAGTIIDISAGKLLDKRYIGALKQRYGHIVGIEEIGAFAELSARFLTQDFEGTLRNGDVTKAEALAHQVFATLKEVLDSDLVQNIATPIEERVNTVVTLVRKQMNQAATVTHTPSVPPATTTSPSTQKQVTVLSTSHKQTQEQLELLQKQVQVKNQQYERALEEKDKEIQALKVQVQKVDKLEETLQAVIKHLPPQALTPVTVRAIGPSTAEPGRNA